MVFHVVPVNIVRLDQQSLAFELPDVFLYVLKLSIDVWLCERRRRQFQEILKVMAIETAKPNLLLQSFHRE